jgi:AcrR family transcriptional regulator
MAHGPTKLSVPAVAREAGVATKTVYRYFATKAELVDAFGEHVFSRSELERMPLPRTVDDLEPSIRDLFHRLDAVDPAVRAALLSKAGWEARRRSIPYRVRMLRDAVHSAQPGLDDAALDHITRLALILTSSFSLQAWRDYLGVSAEEAAAEVAWALRAVIAGAERAA